MLVFSSRAFCSFHSVESGVSLLMTKRPFLLRALSTNVLDMLTVFSI